MVLIVESRFLGSPPTSKYAVSGSDSGLELSINHSRQAPSFHILFPTELRIEPTANVFKHIATLEPFHKIAPIEVRLYDNNQRPVIQNYELTAKASEIATALQGPGHIRLELPGRFFARVLMANCKEPMLSVVSYGGGPVPEYFGEVLPQLGLSMQQGTLESALQSFQKELAFFQTLAAQKN